MLSINYRYRKNTFGDYQKIIDIKKCASNFIRLTQLKTMFQKQKRECFNIPDEYEILYEKSAKNCAAIRAEHLRL